MSDGISAPFIRYPIGTSLIMAGILFRRLSLSPVASCTLPQVDFPTIHVAASLPRRQPGTWPPRWRSPRAHSPRFPHRTDDVDELSGTTAVHDPVRPQSQHRRPPQRCAGGDNAASVQFPKNLPLPDLPQVNPADSPILLLSATSEPCPSPPLATPRRPTRAQISRSPACRR